MNKLVSIGMLILTIQSAKAIHSSICATNKSICAAVSKAIVKGRGEVKSTANKKMGGLSDAQYEACIRGIA